MTPIIDWHCDTILKIHNEGTDSNLKNNPFHIDIDKMKQGGIAAQFFAVFVKLEQNPDPFSKFIQITDRFFAELDDNRDTIGFARSFEDLEENTRQDLISAFLTIEEGEVIAGDPDKLEQAYARGVRLITLTWNYENSIGYPNFHWEYQSKGLKPAGCELVERMNDLGIVIDVSHLSDGGFEDVAALSKQPFVASHSNARAESNHYRNLTDSMIRKLADAGGIMGLNFCPAFLNGTEAATLQDMVRHLAHIKNIGGTEVAAFGSDFDGIQGDLGVKTAADYPELISAMRQAGFTGHEIDLVSSENARRVIREVLT